MGPHIGGDPPHSTWNQDISQRPGAPSFVAHTCSPWRLDYRDFTVDSLVMADPLPNPTPGVGAPCGGVSIIAPRPPHLSIG